MRHNLDDKEGMGNERNVRWKRQARAGNGDKSLVQKITKGEWT